MAGLGNLFRNRNVSPRFASPNQTDEDIADTKPSPKLAVVFGRDQYFAYFAFSQFGITTDDTAWVPTLCNCIMDIFHLSADEQMRGIDTMPDIAFVESQHADRDWSVSQGPSNAMRAYAGLVPGRMFADSELTIPFAEQSGRPHPARSKFSKSCGRRSALVDLAPEPCDRFFIHGNNPPVGHVPGGCHRAGISTVAFRGGEQCQV